MRKAKIAFPALTVAFMAAGGPAAELSPPRFSAGWEAGQIEEAYDPQNKQIDREIINRASVWLSQEAALADRARLRFGLGGAYFFVFPRNLGANPYVHTKRSAFGLTDAHGEFDLWRGAEPGDGLRLKAGIFNYKYNESAQNLGEYLFRTWSYPFIIHTGGLSLLNSAGAQLSGFGAFARRGGFKNDFMLTIQSDHVPIGALSLTEVVTWQTGILTIGGGFAWDNFYHPDKRTLSPHQQGNRYYTVRGGDSVPANTRLSFARLNELKTRNALSANDTMVLDSGHYTYSGQKAMVRASLDFTRFLGGAPHPDHSFGVYFEAAVLGFKNYPTYYEKLNERTVVMGGINIPTFGILQKLSLEVEHSPYPFRQSTNDPNTKGSAVPEVQESFYPAYLPIRGDDWKWSLFAERRLGGGLSAYAQVANDHFRNAYIFGAPAAEGFLTESSHWYWVFKLAIAI